MKPDASPDASPGLPVGGYEIIKADQKEGLYDLKIGSWSQLNIYLGGFGA